MRFVALGIVMYAILTAFALLLTGCGANTVEDVMRRPVRPVVAKPVQCIDDWCTKVRRAQ